MAMRWPRARLTIRRLVVGTAAIAVGLAIIRRDLSLGSFTTAVFLLTLGRTFAVIDRCDELGRPLTSAKRVMLVLSSLAIATTILVISCYFSFVAFVLCGGSYYTHWRHGGRIDSTALLCAVFIGFWVCTLLRRRLWPYRF
jgi:hypothetical protein